MRLLIAALVGVVACSGAGSTGARDVDNDGTPLEPAAFHAMLADREESTRIESVMVRLSPDRPARYAVRFKNGEKRSVEADFPGTIADELYAAGVMYAVAEPERDRRGARLLAATSLREMLASPDEAAKIDHITIESRGSYARYELAMKAVDLVRVAYAEFPGKIVEAIDAAKVPHTIAR